MKCAQRTEWQDGCVDIVFLLALNFQDIQSTRAFFSSFYEMTMEKNTTFLIRKSETEEEMDLNYVKDEGIDILHKKLYNNHIMIGG